MNSLKWLMIGIFLSCSVNAAEFSSLEERMSGQDFKKSGLEKLSKQELDYLNAWLNGQSVLPTANTSPQSASASSQPASASTAATPVVADDRVGFKSKKNDRGSIESGIDGPFTGWSGRTRFKLRNGQVWEQVGGGSHYFKADNPKVRIEPKAFGSWKMYVGDSNRGVKVKRIK